MRAMAQVQRRKPHPCILRLLLPLSAVTTTAVYAGASPESDDLYALSKLKSSLLSRSARNSTLLADWDVSSPATASHHHYCNFSGITCDAASSRVVTINLTGVPLQEGVLPAEISLLDALSSLTVASCDLSGPIPVSLSSMPLLRHLNLSNNHLAGPFFPSSPPPERRRHTGAAAAAAPPPYFPSLEVLDVYNNNLIGPLPPLGGRSNARLRHLHLGGKFFLGSIPEAYGDMEGLEYLGLNGNSLSGRVPPSRALCYMHRECSPRVLHRDVKSSNILRVDEKTDVYSFGVVLMELVTTPATRSTSSPGPVAPCRGHRTPQRCWPPPEPVRLIAGLFRVGISCVRESSQARPTMREVVHVLSSFVPVADHASLTSALPV